MEIGAVASVLGLGWFLSKDGTNPPDRSKIQEVSPTSDTFYQSSQLARAKLGDATQGMLMDAKSRQGLEQGKVVSHPTLHRVRVDDGPSQDPNRFVHNNMTPFFGGRVKNDMREAGFEAKLERFTGMDPYRRTKTEQPVMFEPRPDVGHVYGMPSHANEF